MRLIMCILALFLTFGSIPDTANSSEDAPVETAEEVVEVPQLTYREHLEQLASRGEIRSINAEITAYTASAEECGNDLGITANGEEVQRGFVAADSSIPFGTILYIDGIGRVVVKDRGGAISRNRIDIYMETKDEAVNFGRQYRKVFFIGNE